MWGETTSKATAIPPTPEPTVIPTSFAEIGKRLGSARSAGVSIGDLDGDLDAFVANGELWRDCGGGTPNEVWFKGR